MTRHFPLVAGLLSALTICSYAGTYDWSADPLKGVKIETVAFRGWTPEGTEPLRGTLVLIPGRHGDGRGMAADPKWQALATELKFAILACQFTGGDTGLYQEDANGEVAKCINDAVKRLAKEAAQPGLEKAPLAFWGHSAGSNVSSRYIKFFPDRVAAFASSKGTWGPTGDVGPKTLEIPMFFAVGAKDNPAFVTDSMKNIEKGLGKAPWTLAENANEGHDPAASMNVVMPFLEAAVKLRLGLAAPAAAAGASGGSLFKSELPTMGLSGGSVGDSSKSLKRLSTHDGWLGDAKTYDIAPYADFKGSKAKAIWLPNEATAKAWQAYLKG